MCRPATISLRAVANRCLSTIAVLGAMIVATGPAAAFGPDQPARVKLDGGQDGGVPQTMGFSPDGRSLAVIGISLKLQPKDVAALLAAARSSSSPTGISVPVGPSVSVSLWDTTAGKSKWQRAAESVSPFEAIPVFSPDGRRLAMPAGTPVDRVVSYDVREGKPGTVLKLGPSGSTREGWRMTFSPDGRFLAGCFERPYAIQVWDMATGKPAAAWKAPPNPERDPARTVSVEPPPIYSPDGRLIAVSTGHRVEFRDARSGEPKGAVSLDAWRKDDPARAKGKPQPRSPDARPWPWPFFSPDGKTLVVAPDESEGNRIGPDGAKEVVAKDVVFVIDVAGGKARRVVMDFPCRFLALQADGNVAGVTTHGSHLNLAVCNPETGEVKTVIDRQVPSKLTIAAAAFSPDGAWLATVEKKLISGIPAPWGYTVHLWDTRTGRQAAEMKDDAASDDAGEPAAKESFEAWSGQGPPRLCFSRDGRQLALIVADSATGVVDLWSLGKAHATDAPRADAPSVDAKPKERVRTWTNANGKYSTQAAFVRLDGEVVVLRKESGATLKVPLEKLSEEDRQYARQRASRDEK